VFSALQMQSVVSAGLRANPFCAITPAMTFTPVTPSDIAPGTTRFVQHQGAAFLIVRDADGSVHALDGLCSHALLPLEGARLRRGHIICPHHGARFDITSGAAKGPPAYCGITQYRTQEKDGMIELDLTA
jgi:3-phenylpropionate/trans-cinnamate dioxygenase ferredoxin subunit